VYGNTVFYLSRYVCLRVFATSLSCSYCNHPLVLIVCLWFLSLFFVLSLGHVLFPCPSHWILSLAMLFVLFIGPLPCSFVPVPLALYLLSLDFVTFLYPCLLSCPLTLSIFHVICHVLYFFICSCHLYPVSCLSPLVLCFAPVPLSTSFLVFLRLSFVPALCLPLYMSLVGSLFLLFVPVFYPALCTFPLSMTLSYLSVLCSVLLLIICLSTLSLSVVLVL
jgi:hypothetical protein